MWLAQEARDPQNQLLKAQSAFSVGTAQVQLEHVVQCKSVSVYKVLFWHRRYITFRIILAHTLSLPLWLCHYGDSNHLAWLLVSRGYPR